MGNGLLNKKVMIAGSRKTDEMTTLIEKQGGKALVRPLQGTVFLAEEEVEPDLRKFLENGSDLLIFTTGIGTETLLNLSEKLGMREDFLDLLQKSDVASRGYKTFGVLKKLGIQPVAVDEDGTTEGLIRALNSYPFKGKNVMVQLHGDRIPRLIEFLEHHGATISQLLPYQHIAPDTEVVKTAVEEIIANKTDAVCFTTAIQVRSLFEYAKENGLSNRLKDAFQTNVLAAAVGKVTAEALKEEGLTNYLAPELERMGAMIVELANYYQNQSK